MRRDDIKITPEFPDRSNVYDDGDIPQVDLPQETVVPVEMPYREEPDYGSNFI